MSTDVNDPVVRNQRPDAQPDRRPFRQLAVAVLLVGGCATVAAVLMRMERGLEQARAAITVRDFGTARSAVARYLWLHPTDSEAQLLAASSYALDDSLPPETAARQAIRHLHEIPDHNPASAEARTLEARLTFLILCQPGRAETLFRRAIALDPRRFDAHYLQWKLLDMTERYYQSEGEFWAAFQLVPDARQRAVRLREWYLSQFSPLSACGDLDGLMGFRAQDELASEAVAFRRLSSFYQHEPNSPTTVAAFAHWHLRNHEREAGLEILNNITDREAAFADPFYVATLTEVLLELGKLDQAADVFSRWPQPWGGYQYWRIAGMIQQEFSQNYAEADRLYALALAEWPGPSDWLTMHRRSRCLARLGDVDGSRELRERAESIEKLMELELHQRLKQSLGNLESPSGLREVVRLYQALNRHREVDAWTQVIAELERQHGNAIIAR